MKIFIPIFSSTVTSKLFSSSGQNPGIGGTQFTSIKLALLLSEQYPDLNVYLVNNSRIDLKNSVENIQVVIAEGLNGFLMTLGESHDFIIVMTMALLQDADPAQLMRLRRNVIAWLHHPFQLDTQIRHTKLAAHVHVGGYQFYSNQLFYKSNWYIQNPFTAASRANFGYDAGMTTARMIYLGALIRAKGFGHIAKQWPRIKAVIPHAELHVIGSSATYGKKPEHELIPCDREFAEEILSSISIEDIETGRVVFHGNLGEEKLPLMQSAHLAILNPTGATEAFPASPLECMACGLPVIASDDYGMSDSMRFFPELVIQHPDEIASRVSWLLTDSYRYAELSERSITVAKWFDSQTGVILARWRSLFEHVGELQKERVMQDAPPIEPLYGSLCKLRWRQARVFLGASKRWLRGLLRGSCIT